MFANRPKDNHLARLARISAATPDSLHGHRVRSERTLWASYTNDACRILLVHPTAMQKLRHLTSGNPRPLR
jgi:hypothetical protein